MWYSACKVLAIPLIADQGHFESSRMDIAVIAVGDGQHASTVSFLRSTGAISNQSLCYLAVTSDNLRTF